MPQTKSRRAVRTHRRFQGAIVVLAVIAIAVFIAVAISLRSRERVEPEPEDPHAGQVLVNDGNAEVWLSVQEGVPVSPLQAEAFEPLGDQVAYYGHDAYAVQGIDVSEFQGDIDWQAVADSGISFAYIRAGYRGYNAGTIGADERFLTNLAGARAAGIKVGAYFFSQAITAEEAAEEAKFTVELLNGAKLDLPIMFDWETVSDSSARTNGLDGETITDCAEAFCKAAKKAGYEAGIYFSRQQGYYVYDLSRLSDYTFWVADPNPSPDFYYRMDVWQYDFEGDVPGIGIITDRNMMFLYD